METWKHGNMETWGWRHGGGDIETWKHGNMETWRHGDGDMETWRHGDMETWTWRQKTENGSPGDFL
jgi:hypothetical protein